MIQSNIMEQYRNALLIVYHAARGNVPGQRWGSNQTVNVKDGSTLLSEIESFYHISISRQFQMGHHEGGNIIGSQKDD